MFFKSTIFKFYMCMQNNHLLIDRELKMRYKWIEVLQDLQMNLFHILKKEINCNHDDFNKKYHNTLVK